MIDTLVVYGKWPFRRIEFDWIELLEKMDENGVEKAMLFNVNGAFYRDAHEANLELFEVLKKLPREVERRFIVMGVVNPIYPGWEHDLNFLLESGVRIVVLLPNYHGYSLKDPALSHFWRFISTHDIIVSFVAKFEDPRQRHRLDANDLLENDVIDLLRTYRNLKVILHNFGYSSSLSIYLSNPDHDHLFFDLNFFYEVPTGEPTKFVRIVGKDRVVFSSFHPFRYYKAGIMKLIETGIMDSRDFERKFREALKWDSK